MEKHRATTVIRNDEVMYCLKTNGYNHIAKQDDRRKHDRLIISLAGKVFDGRSEEGVDIIVHDISDIGISFYAPKTFLPNDTQLTIVFSDTIDEKEFNVKVDCAIARTANKAGNRFVGCKILTESKEYYLYGVMKRLSKNKRIV